MRLAPAPRWAISFADLTLVLFGSFVMINAMRAAQEEETPAPAPGAALSDPAIELDAIELFEPGEARLTGAGRARLAELAQTAAGRRLTIASRGLDGGGRRLDAFELAAARTAAVARALGSDQRSLSAAVAAGSEVPPGQRITVTFLD